VGAKRGEEDNRALQTDVGVLPKRDFRISVLCATRPLIQLVLWRRVEAVANITLRPASRVTGIAPAATGRRGIQFVNGSGRSETLDTDLVVDASGRGAPTLTLLDALGWERPQMTESGADISYATAGRRGTSDPPAEWRAVLTLPDPPPLALHSVLVPTEDGRWIIAIPDHSATTWIRTLNRVQRTSASTRPSGRPSAIHDNDSSPVAIALRRMARKSRTHMCPAAAGGQYAAVKDLGMSRISA
jgi:hypothetical protein